MIRSILRGRTSVPSAVFVFALATSTTMASPATAQSDASRVSRLVPSSETITVAIGERSAFSVAAVDASGNAVDVPVGFAKVPVIACGANLSSGN